MPTRTYRVAELDKKCSYAGPTGGAAVCNRRATTVGYYPANGAPFWRCWSHRGLVTGGPVRLVSTNMVEVEFIEPQPVRAWWWDRLLDWLERVPLHNLQLALVLAILIGFAALAFGFFPFSVEPLPPTWLVVAGRIVGSPLALVVAGLWPIVRGREREQAEKHTSGADQTH